MKPILFAFFFLIASFLVNTSVEAANATPAKVTGVKVTHTGYICVNAFTMMPSYVSAYDDTTKYCYHIVARFTVGSEAFLMEVTSDNTNYSIIPCK